MIHLCVGVATQLDVQMYTNDAKTLGQVLSRDVSHPSATQQMAMHDELAGQKIMPSVDLNISQGYGLGLGH